MLRTSCLMAAPKPAPGGGGGTDPNFSSVVLLLHGDAASAPIVDYSGSAKTVTISGGVSQTAGAAKFGGRGINFPGVSGDSLSLAPSADWNFGSGVGTVEFWFKRIGAQVSVARMVEYDVSNAIAIYWNQLGATNQISVGLGGVYPAITSGVIDQNWHFLQLIRDSATSTKLYIDGVQEGLTYMVNYSISSAQSLFLGAYSSAGYEFVGALDDVRFTKGVARAPGVPTAAFPNS